MPKQPLPAVAKTYMLLIYSQPLQCNMQACPHSHVPKNQPMCMYVSSVIKRQVSRPNYQNTLQQRLHQFGLAGADMSLEVGRAHVMPHNT